MKFRADRTELADAVAWVGRAVPRRPAVPVVGGMLVDVTPGQARLSAFDYDVSLATSVRVEAEDTHRFLVPGHLFVQIMPELPHHPLDVDVDATKAVITCGPATYTMPLMPVEDYPTLPSIPEPLGEIDGEVFAEAVSQTEFAAAADDTLPMLAGVHVVFEDTTAEFVATDRYRLPRRRVPWTPRQQHAPIAVTIGVRILNDVAKGAKGPLQVGVVQDNDGAVNLVGFTSADRQATARVLDPTFPSYRDRYVQIDEMLASGTELLVDVATLMSTLKRAVLFKDSPASPIRLQVVNGELQIESGHGSQRMVEPVPAEVTGDDLVVGFNADFLRDALGSVHTSKARMRLLGSKPALITPVGDGVAYEHIVMPVRLMP